MTNVRCLLRHHSHCVHQVQSSFATMLEWPEICYTESINWAIFLCTNYCIKDQCSVYIINKKTSL
jgi:hypothetical protein